MRLELQAEKGDTQILYDGHTRRALRRRLEHALPLHAPGRRSRAKARSGPERRRHDHEAPSVAKIEEAISHLSKHATVSGATPTDVAGQPAYTVRVSPKEAGSLIGGAELSFDAVHGVPLRAAIYSSTSSAPVIELAATEISYGPVADSVFEFTPPPGAKVEEARSLPQARRPPAARHADASARPSRRSPPTATASRRSRCSKARPRAPARQSPALEGLPKVKINGASASELRTALGTLLSFERSGVRYVLAGSVTPAAIEARRRGL